MSKYKKKLVIATDFITKKPMICIRKFNKAIINSFLVKNLFTQSKINTTDNKSGFLLRSLSTMPGNTGRRVYINVDSSKLDLQSTNSELNNTHNKSQKHFVNNRVITSRYTVLNFIPKNLFLQFKRFANIFFLLIAIVQAIYLETLSDKILGCWPLTFVLFLSAIKDGIEDYKRHKVDKLFNRSKTTTLQNWSNVNLHIKTKGTKLSNNINKNDLKKMNLKNKVRRSTKKFRSKESQLETIELKENINKKTNNFNSTSRVTDMNNNIPCFRHCHWEDVEVGDFILIEKEEQVPADVVLISTSDNTSGECYVETKSLDGETNLKTRYALIETMHVTKALECASLKAYIEVDAPSSNLHTLNGSITLLNNSYKDDNNHDPTTSNLNGINTADSSINKGSTLISLDENNIKQKQPNSNVKIVPFSIKNMLLRGYVLKNIDYAIGVVVYTGRDTRIVLNSGKTPTKISKVEKIMNKQVVTNFIILILLTLALCIVYIQNAKEYINKPSALMFGILDASAFVGIQQFFNGLILLQNVVPISLYVSIELVKTLQAYFIAQDINMYDEENNYKCIPRSLNLSDDLGQIQYIFSDKTGTLTKNIMELKRLIIGNKIYGKSEISSFNPNNIKTNVFSSTKKKNKSNEAYINEKLENENQRKKAKMLRDQHYTSMEKLFKSKYVSIIEDPKKLSFVDPGFFEDIISSNNDKNLIQGKLNKEFLTHLALCHSVLIDNSYTLSDEEKRTVKISDSKDGSIESNNIIADSLIYRAESPDEKTLVTSAKDLGFTFVGKSKQILNVDVLGVEYKYEMLDFIEFNSSRKRMSVILRRPQPYNDIVLLCKGADNIIIERLKEGQEEYISFISDNLKKFSTIGLRTLCLCSKRLSEGYYSDWHNKYVKAQAITNNRKREEEMDLLSDEIEKDMNLIGATAIEDKLQDQVPETIKALRMAGIKVWVLTGDKMETAINIGMSCNLITEELKIWTIGPGIKKEVKDNFEHIANQIVDEEANVQYKNQEHALVVEGIAFKHILEDSELRNLFLRISDKFSSVICCRVTPLQKAQAVHLIKKGKNSMCLSIGDGANDVSMIQEAHIGVAIAGQEGLQASMASDYSISQFKHLRNLLLVHGQWSYHRLSMMILCFFYKNALFPFVAFWYQFHSGYSANIFYVYLVSQIYNIVFTATGVVLLGCFDRILNYETLFNNPRLYRITNKGDLFSFKKYFLYFIDGIWHSLVCYFTFFYIYSDNVTSYSGTSDTGLEMSTSSAIAIVIVANLLIGFQTKSWVVWIFVSVILTIVSVFIILPVYSLFQVDTSFYYVPIHLFRENINVYFSIPLFVITSMLPRYILYAYKAMFIPSDYDIIREARK